MNVRIRIPRLSEEEVAALAARFWSKVNKQAPNGCWEWTAGRFSAGYGAVHIPGRKQPMLAHRVSWRLAHGRWPRILVLHRCDNPPCVNPDHLFVGTYQDNVTDCCRKERFARGARHHKAKLTEDQVREIRRWKGLKRAVDLASEYGVAKGTITSLLSGRSWARVQMSP